MENRFLYRGKRSDNGEWVEGFLFMVNDVPYILPHHKTGQPIHADNLLKTVVEVLEDTICQCTGLKDKNGKRIFENDILKDNVIYGVVKWDDANARYIIDDREDGYQDYSEWWHECEIIGNIFDDPELLEA